MLDDEFRVLFCASHNCQTRGQPHMGIGIGLCIVGKTGVSNDENPGSIRRSKLGETSAMTAVVIEPLDRRGNLAILRNQQRTAVGSPINYVLLRIQPSHRARRSPFQGVNRKRSIGGTSEN